VDDAVGLYGIKAQVGIALSIPQSAPTDNALPPTLGNRFLALGYLLCLGRDIFSHKKTEHRDHQRGLHNNPDQSGDRHAGTAHNHNLTGAGQLTQAHQAANQCSKGHVLINSPRQCEQYKPGHIEKSIAFRHAL